jgi:hypothetical protein
MVPVAAFAVKAYIELELFRKIFSGFSSGGQCNVTGHFKVFAKRQAPHSHLHGPSIQIMTPLIDFESRAS